MIALTACALAVVDRPTAYVESLRCIDMDGPGRKATATLGPGSCLRDGDHAGKAATSEVQQANPVGTDRNPGDAGSGMVDHLEELAGGVRPKALPGRVGVVRIDPIDFGDARLARE